MVSIVIFHVGVYKCKGMLITYTKLTNLIVSLEVTICDSYYIGTSCEAHNYRGASKFLLHTSVVVATIQNSMPMGVCMRAVVQAG